MKPYLVLLRCGPDSLPLDRLEALASPEFDLALSCSGPVPPSPTCAVFVHACEGAKWPALAQTLAAHAAQIAGYRHVWMPDEQVQFDAATLERLFLICDQLDLELAQPAFTPGSVASHPAALQHPEFQLRFTNGVDTAAPLLSRSMLAKVLPTLADTRLLPHALWPHLSRPGRVAVIDATPVTRGPAAAAPAAVDDALLNLGGLLDSGDAWCLSAQAGDVEVLLQALTSSCAAMKLDARASTRYLAQHLALADSGAAAPIRADLERELAAVGMRFNCAQPPRPQEAPAPLTAGEADLCDLQARYAALLDERAAQDELLQRLAEQLGQLAQEVSALPTAARRIEAV